MRKHTFPLFKWHLVAPWYTRLYYTYFLYLQKFDYTFYPTTCAPAMRRDVNFFLWIKKQTRTFLVVNIISQSKSGSKWIRRTHAFMYPSDKEASPTPNVDLTSLLLYSDHKIDFILFYHKPTTSKTNNMKDWSIRVRGYLVILSLSVIWIKFFVWIKLLFVYCVK